MRIFLGLGSNLGDRRSNLEAALEKLHSLLKPQVFKVSPVYETAALLPEGAPPEWNRGYLNAVVEIESPIEPRFLLNVAREIEDRSGRDRKGRWSPREIDLDILLYGKEKIEDADLKVPHPELQNRAFVLDPLKDLNSAYVTAARAHPDHRPLVMGIVNLTPDSFSDGGKWNEKNLSTELSKWADHGVAMIDFGAESTRPGAKAISWQEEWFRLKPALETAQALFKNRRLKPKISVDTRHFETAALSIEYGADIINDVSGLADSKFLPMIKNSRREYVLMHSLSVPADPHRVIHGEVDPVTEILRWFELKTRELEDAGVRRDQIILDPGIGFGKTAEQSRLLIERISEFAHLPYRLLIGHSRKSFLGGTLAERDLASIEISRRLRPHADILRVHDPLKHLEALNA